MPSLIQYVRRLASAIYLLLPVPASLAGNHLLGFIDAIACVYHIFNLPSVTTIWLFALPPGDLCTDSTWVTKGIRCKEVLWKSVPPKK